MIAAIDAAAARRGRRRNTHASPVAGEIAKRLDERLDIMKLTPATVLETSHGDGVSLKALRRRYPKADIVVAGDAAAAVPRTSRGIGAFVRRIVGAEGGTLRIRGSVAELPLADASIDFVWSNLGLAYVADPLPALREAARALKSGGLLMFSTLGPDTLKEMRAAFRQADPAYPHVHDFIDMHDLGDMLIACGLTAPVMEMERIVFTYQDVNALAADLRAVGMTNALAARRRGFTGRRLWQRFKDAYAGFSQEHRLPATFEVVYGHAWKPAPPAAAAHTPQVVKFYPPASRRGA